MASVDSTTALPVGPAWTAFVHRAAVTAGCLAALVALLGHVPAHVASLRGGLAWGAVLVVGRLGRWLLERTAASDEDEGPQETAEPD